MVAEELTPGGAGAGVGQAPALPWERFVLGLDQVLERFLRENPNGLSGALDRSDRPDTSATPKSPGSGNPMGSPSAPAPPAQSGGHDGDQGSSADETSKAVDCVIESLWGEDSSSGVSGQSTSGWGLAREATYGAVAEFRVVPSLERASPPCDSTWETGGFGDRRRAIRLPLHGPGKDEPSLAAPVAFVVLAHAWAQSRVVSRVSGARIPLVLIETGERVNLQNETVEGER